MNIKAEMNELINKEHKQWKANVRIGRLNKMALWRTVKKIKKNKRDEILVKSIRWKKKIEE